MALLEIGDQKIEVHDDFLKLSPEEQNDAVTKIAMEIGAAPKAAKEPGYSKIGQGRAEGLQILRGVPIAGAFADKAAAMLNAAAQPVTETGLSNKPDFYDRYVENKQLLKEGGDAYAREKPVAAMAQQFAGGTAALAPLAASSIAAKALGMSGTLPQMVVRGGASGAGIGAADEALRGGSAVRGAEIGGITGAGFPLAARAVGAAVRGVRGAVSPAGPREAPTVDINGVQVPRFQSQMTGNNADGSAEQAFLSGARGEVPQQIAQQAQERRGAAMEQARDKFGRDLSPATSPAMGAPPDAVPATPHVAGDQVITELAARQNAEMERNALSGVAREVSDFQARDVTPGGGMPATSMEASQIVGSRIGESAREAATARTGAYQRAGEVDGVFNPAGFERISTSLEQRLNSGAPEQRVRVNDSTPRTREALQLIENEIGSGRRPANEVDPRTRGYNAALDAGIDARPAPPITGRDLEAVRQQLVPLVRDANNAARAPGGSYADARGMRRVMEAFDQHVREVVRAGGFSGDGTELLRRYDAARAAHSAYRGTYSARGQGDIVGPVIEKIIGKHPGQQMQPDAVASAMYGSTTNPGGGNTVAVAQRAREILGPQSQEWGAAKQGYLSHILDTPHGTAPLTPLEQAERIYAAVNGKGAALTQVYLSPDEIARLTSHADMLRNLFPARGPLNSVDKQIMRLSGADGHPPASSRDVVDAIMGADGTKASAVPLLTRLKSTLSPESWDSVRQGTWSRLTDKPEGVIDWGPQALSQRIHKFLSEPHAEVLYNAKERQMMKIIADEYKSQIPLANTTNPSGSGIFATKMVRAAQGNLLPMLGLATHGPAGVIGGAAANRALSFVAGRKAKNEAMDLFNGKAMSIPGVKKNHERAAAILAKAAQPLVPLAPPQQQSTGQ